MAFTLVGYSDTVTTAGTTLEEVSALADQHVTVSGNDITVPELNRVVGVYALGSSITQARLCSPSLRRVVQPDIEPIDTNDEPSSTPPYYDLRLRPAMLDRSEAMTFQTATAATSGRSVGLVWLSNGEIEALPEGPIFTVRCTNTTTLGAFAWTAGALTFAQTLPAGRYAVVGMRAQSATCIGARLVFPGGRWRPGCIGCDADADVADGMFRFGRMGVWGEFEHNQPPQVEFLAVTTDSSQVVHLDLIQTRAGVA